MEEKIEVATIVGGRDNPFTTRRKNGKISKNEQRKNSSGLGTLRARQTITSGSH
jgi:hypothetical protein